MARQSSLPLLSVFSGFSARGGVAGADTWESSRAAILAFPILLNITEGREVLLTFAYSSDEVLSGVDENTLAKLLK